MGTSRVTRTSLLRTPSRWAAATMAGAALRRNDITRHTSGMTSRAIRFAAPMGAAPGGQGDRRGSDATKRRSSRLRAQRLPQHVGHGRAAGQGSKRLAVTFVDPALAPLYPLQRSHRLVHLIPAAYYDRHFDRYDLV